MILRTIVPVNLLSSHNGNRVYNRKSVEVCLAICIYFNLICCCLIPFVHTTLHTIHKMFEFIAVRHIARLNTFMDGCLSSYWAYAAAGICRSLPGLVTPTCWQFQQLSSHSRFGWILIVPSLPPLRDWQSFRHYRTMVPQSPKNCNLLLIKWSCNAQMLRFSLPLLMLQQAASQQLNERINVYLAN